ncbi:hypothetical protein GY45DRAFT_1320213 [Cubamyces sp. BRFM 1775]|nr:hypothetical protein GY45DRAFT_1320213 [Cubamyces sp. BRFM 1775]
MDTQTLSKLPFVELQEIAEREGIRANQSKKAIITELIEKYHPMLVPYPALSSVSVSGSASMRDIRRPFASASTSTSASATRSLTSPRPDTRGTSGQTAVPVHYPKLKELRKTLNLIAPLADAEQDTREEVRELQVLVTSIGRRTLALVEKSRRLQQLRLALEQHMPELEKYFLPQAGKAAPRTESTEKSAAGEGEDEEEELAEVEEMTSREVDFSDLPSTPNGSVEKEGRGKKRARPVDDASPDDSPRKRARARSSV